METRDQWYKPNLLYNIHYRPPKKPEPPKMIVETMQFNPSVCTCGEHGCQPQYRMEKRVLWTNKEVCNTKQQTNVIFIEMKNEYKESKFKDQITKQERKTGGVIKSKQMELKENALDFRFMTDSDGNKCGSAVSFKERMSCEVEVSCGYKAFCERKEIGNVKVQDDTDYDNDDEKKKKKEEFICKNEVGLNDSNDDEEASNKNNIKENNSNGRSERDYFEGSNIEGEKNTGNDSKSVFDNDCKLDGNSFKEDKIDKDHTTGEGHRAVDSDCAGDDEEYCSENRILITTSNETAESCSLESRDEGLEDVEIASDFGIMSIYCNSELHSWMNFEGKSA